MISQILQILEMKKKKITVLVSSLQAALASLLALLQLYGTLAIKISQEQRKLVTLLNSKSSHVSKYDAEKNQQRD